MKMLKLTLLQKVKRLFGYPSITTDHIEDFCYWAIGTNCDLSLTKRVLFSFPNHDTKQVYFVFVVTAANKDARIKIRFKSRFPRGKMYYELSQQENVVKYISEHVLRACLRSFDEIC